MRLPAGYAAAPLLELSQANGASFMPGNAFSLTDGLATSLRLSFSRYGPHQLADAARRIGEAFQRSGPES